MGQAKLFPNTIPNFGHRTSVDSWNKFIEKEILELKQETEKRLEIWKKENRSKRLKNIL